MKTLIIGFIGLVLFFNAPAQNISGSWYGKADVMIAGNSSNYLTEMVLKQKGNEVEGVFGYYFKDAYQSFFVRGIYNRSTRQVLIKDLPLLFYASATKNGIECPMSFSGTLMVSQIGSTIKGNFYTDPKYKYTCPDLRVSMVMDESERNQDSVLKNTIAGKKFWKPQEEDVVVMAKTYADSATADTVNTNKSLTDAFGKRHNIYEKDIVVYDDSILVSFYDNGDIDDDTISVFLNKKPVLIKRGLTSRALNIYISLDPSIEVNELSMFAENLGKYPPNTALMVVSDGKMRYDVYLSASLTQNASIRLRRPTR
ncbi:MAG: hypothetical protein ABI415_11970 [Flavitalea sp.]